ncbi:MAG: diaminopimelate epimerase [Pseudomonadota bacterium]|nr:diaminopimelate epimerase [Pseudomonadota bacterium]
MKLRFSKMEGLGNDFIVINAVTQFIADAKREKLFSERYIRQLSDRHFGVGFDQMLVVEPPVHPTSDFHYRIFNADGSEVGNCGNGARCFARFVQQEKLTYKNEIVVDIMGGAQTLTLQVNMNKTVTVNMGAPIFDAASIPVDPSQAQQREILEPAPAEKLSLELDGQTYDFVCVSMGNPHAVAVVDSIRETPVKQLGHLVQQHPCFPESVNVGFMQILDTREVLLRVYERGAGETMACGTGACAAIVAGQCLGLLDDGVTARLRGGELNIDFAFDSGYDPEAPVMMTGPARTVFVGQLIL